MVKDEKRINQILESLETAIEAAEYLLSLVGKEKEFLKIVEDLTILLNKIGQTFIEMGEEEAYLLEIEKGYTQNAVYSLSNIVYKFYHSHILSTDQIEYELLPLLENMRYEFFYAVYIKGDIEREKEFLLKDTPKLTANLYIDESMKTGTYKYDVSIVILAYNKLEYTKLCVESVLRYTPKDIKYELILVNHGSSDGTKEYFQSIGVTKIFDLQRNGIGINAHYRIVEGKFYLLVSNDVVVTKNYLENLLKCIESDENITIVVPTTPNVSNLQTIPSESYLTFDEMHTFAQRNNVSDPFRWEERAKLCNPIGLYRSEAWYSSEGLGDACKLFSMMWMFPDDAFSTIFRRHGKKMILAKDTFCHHFGSITLKEENVNTDENFMKGRRLFERFFGIDPWGTGFCYDLNLHDILAPKDTEPVKVLGINCGIGSNPLKIKESLKEIAHNLDVSIYNVTDQKRYFEDLNGLSQFAVYRKDPIDFKNVFEGVHFQYIIFESGMERYSSKKTLPKLMDKLSTGGVLCVLDWSSDKSEKVESMLYKGHSWYLYRKQ